MRHHVSRYGFPFSTVIVITGLTLPIVTQAYVGPGAGLSLLTALWGLVVAIGVAVFFLIMWPIRRMRRRKAANQGSSASDVDHDAAPSSAQRNTRARATSDHLTESPQPRED